MKKKFTKNLKLSKKTVSSLTNQAIKGQGFSDGCTDGCTPLQSWYNCTEANCSADCPVGSQPECMPPPTKGIDQIQ